MFKSIRFKIALMFVLLTLFIIILIGTFMVNSTDRYYHTEFRSLMSTVFNSEYVAQLEATINDENSAGVIYNNIYSYYSSQIGIDSFRNIYLLDGTTGKALLNLSSNANLAESLDISTNIITAMNGRYGDEVNTAHPYMDYAVPLNDDSGVKYIVYIRDTKEETNSIVGNIFSIMMESMFLGLIISLLFSILLSKTILAPIDSLTNKAKRISSGDFETMIDIRSADEIGKLTETFNTMATELKKTLNDIHGEKEKVETILRYMTDGVIAFDTNGEIIHINPAAKNLMKLKAGSAPTFEEMFSGCDITIAQVTCLGHFENIERMLTIGKRELSIYFAPFKTNRKSGGLIAVIQDITEQKKLDNARREFVANVSHELRTPLTTVKSYTETLMELSNDGSCDSDVLTSFLGTINNETDRMTRLVKDLLLLSRLDYGITDFNKEYFSMADLISDIVSRLRHQAIDKKQTIVYEPTNKLPLYHGNIDRIEQVITNIITNAIKYTPENGAITVSTMYMFESIVIKVKDTGIGISQENLEHIFERFYRVDKARSREMGGTGLGLAIAKEIVEAHNGTISIKSVPDYGTDVIIKLPVQTETKENQQNKPNNA